MSTRMNNSHNGTASLQYDHECEFSMGHFVSSSKGNRDTKA